MRWWIVCGLVVTLAAMPSGDVSASSMQFQSRRLIFQPCVQRELKLDRAQIESMIVLENMRKIYSDIGTTNLPDDVLQEMEEHRTALLSPLSATQRKRFEQIENQLRGISAIYSPREHRERLELTSDQHRRLFHVEEVEIAEERAFLKTNPPDETVVRRHLELQARGVKRALKLLNPRQRSIWNEMVGPPFTWDDRDGVPVIDNARNLR
jgi:hypothetical protein